MSYSVMPYAVSLDVIRACHGGLTEVQREQVLTADDASLLKLDAFFAKSDVPACEVVLSRFLAGKSFENVMETSKYWYVVEHLAAIFGNMLDNDAWSPSYDTVLYDNDFIKFDAWLGAGIAK